MLPWIVSQVWVDFIFTLGKIWVDFQLCCSLGPAEVPVANFEARDISIEADTKRQKKSGSAWITCCLVPLAQSASTLIAFSSRDCSRTSQEQAFDDGMCQLNWGYF